MKGWERNRMCIRNGSWGIVSVICYGGQCYSIQSHHIYSDHISCPPTAHHKQDPRKNWVYGHVWTLHLKTILQLSLRIVVALKNMQQSWSQIFTSSDWTFSKSIPKKWKSRGENVPLLANIWWTRITKAASSSPLDSLHHRVKKKMHTSTRTHKIFSINIR